MRRSILVFTCVAVWAASMPAPAADPVGRQAQAARRDPLGGVLTDQTMTAAGQDFYQSFSALWHDKPLSEQFSIAIRERPSARLGNRIQIEYQNRTIFEAVLPAARGNIKAISARAVELAYRNVSNAEVRRLLFRDQDLAADEF